MIFNMIASGGGASAPRFGVAFGKPKPSPGTSLSFTNLLGEPQAFCVVLVPESGGSITKVNPYIGTNNYMVTHFIYDGVEISTGVFNRSNSTYPFNAFGNGYNAAHNAYSFTYSDGTLTLNTRATGSDQRGAFYNEGQYELLYIY